MPIQYSNCMLKQRVVTQLEPKTFRSKIVENFEYLFQLLLVSIDLLYTLLDSVESTFDLVVETSNFSFENITVGLFAVVTDLLVAVGAGVDVGFFGADVATGHDGVRVGIRQLP